MKAPETAESAGNAPELHERTPEPRVARKDLTVVTRPAAPLSHSRAAWSERRTAWKRSGTWSQGRAVSGPDILPLRELDPC